MEIKEELLEKIKFHLACVLAPVVIETMGIDYLAEQFAYKIEFEMLGQKDPQIYSVGIEFPKNWFQHFKERYYPNWLKKKFPVKYKMHTREITLTYAALLPKFNKKFPNQEVIMHILSPTDKDVWKK